MKVLDLSGRKFNRWNVVEFAYSKNNKRYWKCVCDCQLDLPEEKREYKYIITNNLKSGKSKSCGCQMLDVLHNRKQFNQYDLSGKYGVGYDNNGNEFYFDLEDYNKIKNYKWRLDKDKYVIANEIREKTTTIKMHRLILGLTNPKIQVDHIKHINYDNRKSELRIVTNSQNGMNKDKPKNNTSGHRGVSWDKNKNKWDVRIRKDNIQYYLGAYDNFEEAVEIRLDAERNLFREFAYDYSQNLIGEKNKMRKSKNELEKIKEKYNVDELWSFSKFDSYRTSHFEWMLKYIQKLKPNNDNMSAYSSLGNAVHESLEKYYTNELKYEELADEFDNAFTTMIEVAGLYFDRCDNTKNNNIKDKYYKNLIHYFKNFTPIQAKTLMEQFVAIKITNDIVFQGYIDCIHKDDNENVIITDFKTSTKYSAKALVDHSAQLVLYAEGLRQKGIPKEKIKCRFLFLKYIDVDCEQVNGKIKTRSIERCDIGNSLQASAKVWLKKLGYEEDMLTYLDALAQTNDINSLPKDVAAKYVIRDCEVYLEDIWDTYDNLKEEIVETVKDIRNKVEKYNELKDIDIDAAEHLFWDDEDSLKTQSYYYNNLSDYNIPTIRPYKQYLDKINAEKNGDVFGNVSNESNEYDENDLSWLDQL